jgi:hypothetical protein
MARKARRCDRGMCGWRVLKLAALQGVIGCGSRRMTTGIIRRRNGGNYESTLRVVYILT